MRIVFLIALILTLSLAASTTARATTCAEYAYEQLVLTLDAEPAPDDAVPPALVVSNSTDGGRTVLVRNTAKPFTIGQFLELTAEVTPTWLESCFINQVQTGRSGGRCSVPYKAVLPGTYSFKKHWYYEPADTQVKLLRLAIEPDRRHALLTYSSTSGTVEKRYAITASSFRKALFVPCPTKPSSTDRGSRGCSACSMNERAGRTKVQCWLLLLLGAWTFIHRRRTRRAS